MPVDLHNDFNSFRRMEAGPDRDMSKLFSRYYDDLRQLLPDGDDKDGCLRLLLEARDCAVRSMVDS
jgi:ferritin-like protein